jgi:hypothetical protein
MISQLGSDTAFVGSQREPAPSPQRYPTVA